MRLSAPLQASCLDEAATLLIVRVFGFPHTLGTHTTVQPFLKLTFLGIGIRSVGPVVYMPADDEHDANGPQASEPSATDRPKRSNQHKPLRTHLTPKAYALSFA